ncbi:MAG: redoxin domain-containing protein [Deltaproteobacteria bacterium]|nr:redoxin domain-containing protein [Deltaproteobacteria bacterium]
MFYPLNRKSPLPSFCTRGSALITAALTVCLLLLPAGVPASGAKPAQSVKTQQVAPSAPAAPQEKAPDFVLRDLKGQKFRLSDYRGKQPVLIIFSTTWCAFCKSEIPHFKAFHSTYAKQGLEIVNIDIQESKAKVAKFAADNRLPYRVLLDEEGIAAGIYEVRGVPSLVLVDKNGMIVCSECRNVEGLIDAALKK